MSSRSEIPEAIVETRSRQVSLAWIIPMIALGLVLLVLVQAWWNRGLAVTVDFRRGHGLEAGDAVRLRDIEIGRVAALRLADNGTVVQVELAIDRDFARFMKEGSRFSIQRPQIDFGGVQGLDTLLGARYVKVIPGEGPPRRTFVGLESPPDVEDIAPGDLEIVLEANHRSGMRAGGVITYRGMLAGRIRSVELAPDAAHVEARGVVHARYAPLVRDNTRFFATSGLALELSLGGIRAEVDSIESMVAGGVGFATPPRAGQPVDAGGRFALAPEPEDDWLKWAPRVAIGEFTVGTTTPPPAIRAALRWRSGLFSLRRSRVGWLLPVEGGVLAPLSMVQPPAKAKEPRFEYEGGAVEPGLVEVLVEHGAVGILGLSLPPDSSRMPRERIGMLKQDEAGRPVPELLLAWTGAAPVAIGPANLRAAEWGFEIDPALAFAQDDLGAPVTAAEGGLLVGLLIIDGDGAGKVAFLPPPSR
ncbi:MAG: MlaD family protein [Phycisphaerales bacterium]|nr:MlaD family protein [Phycisphaerales bacterium]